MNVNTMGPSDQHRTNIRNERLRVLARDYSVRTNYDTAFVISRTHTVETHYDATTSRYKIVRTWHNARLFATLNNRAAA